MERQPTARLAASSARRDQPGATRTGQQSGPPWRGGQATSPYEQNTQQSPGVGLSNSPQSTHSWNQTQAFVGIVCVLCAPQWGQVMVDCRLGVFMRFVPSRPCDECVRRGSVFSISVVPLQVMRRRVSSRRTRWCHSAPSRCSPITK